MITTGDLEKKMEERDKRIKDAYFTVREIERMKKMVTFSNVSFVDVSGNVLNTIGGTAHPDTFEAIVKTVFENAASDGMKIYLKTLNDMIEEWMPDVKEDHKIEVPLPDLLAPASELDDEEEGTSEAEVA